MMHLRRQGRPLFASHVEVDTARGTKALVQQVKSGERAVQSQVIWEIQLEQ